MFWFWLFIVNAVLWTAGAVVAYIDTQHFAVDLLVALLWFCLASYEYRLNKKVK